MRPFKVALVQFAPAPPSSAASTDALARALAFVAEAAAQKCQLVVLPEYHLQGIIADPEHHQLAQREHGESAVDEDTETAWLEQYRSAAIKGGIDICCGTIVERETSTGLLHNVATYINSSGEILNRYRKRNLWHPEKEYLTPGEPDHVAFDTAHAKVGMMICWDMAWPEGFRSLLVQGAEVVIVPTFWTATDATPLGLSHNPDCETLFLDNLIVTRACENECAVIFVNCGGTAQEGFIGRSAVALPFKGIVAQAQGCKEQMVVTEIDLDIIADARKVYGIRDDLLKRRATALSAGLPALPGLI